MSRGSYIRKEHESGILPGDLVLVTRKASTYEKGWLNSWTPQMDKFVGEVCEVKRVCSHAYDSAAGIDLKGDKVLVHAKVFTKEWPETWWNPQYMDDLIGEVGVVVDVATRTGCKVRFRVHDLGLGIPVMSFWFPPESLRLANSLSSIPDVKLLYL